jgi:hypothetical protein
MDIFDVAIEEDLCSGFFETQQAACHLITQRAEDVASRKSPDDFKKWFSQQQKKLFECVFCLPVPSQHGEQFDVAWAGRAHPPPCPYAQRLALAPAAVT